MPATSPRHAALPLLLALATAALASRTKAAAQVCTTGTVCAAGYSVSGQGCCPMDNAVCCSNKQTCCPQGTTCAGSGYLMTCQGAPPNQTASVSVCKPGAAMPMSTTLPNILIIGDSVSIGYTPDVARRMAKVALVQHSPYGETAAPCW